MVGTRHDLSSFGGLLKAFRTRRHLTQQQLASFIGVHRSAIVRWEQGDFLPQGKALVLELARHLKLDDQETRELLEASLTALAPYWSVPLPRNLFFTGREEILEALHPHLSTGQPVALTQSYALQGLGGIGKTQLALEYAYRHALEYRAVFWIGAETDEQIIASLRQIAELLQLPGQEDQDQQRVVAALQRWLSTHNRWLLIWDNIEDLAVLDRFLPATRSGTILITTRCQTLGTCAQGLDLLPMNQEEGMLFLLRRAKVLGPKATEEHIRQLAEQMPAQYRTAADLVRDMGGLPLALDQAGAYLEETRCGLPAYLELFHTQRAVLLLQRRGRSCHHPASVSTTFTLAITATTRGHPALWDLLQVCALVQPDAIPEELFRQGSEHLGAQLQVAGRAALEWNELVADACAYSLVSRHPEEQTLSLHRLVQAILLDAMTEAEQEQWIRRVMAALDAVFPEILPATEYATWKQGKRLLPHARLCLHRAGVADETLVLASLTYKVALYLSARGPSAEAEPLFQRALHIREQTLGSEHPDVASSLHYLALLYWSQGKYAQAEPLYQRALHIWEQVHHADHPDVASPLNNLALLQRDQGKYEQAEPLWQRALSIWEQTLGPGHPLVAQALNNLALLYYQQGKNAEAEPLFQRALHILEHALGPDHPDMVQALNNLANLYYQQGKNAEAESLYQRALRISERSQRADHPDVAVSLTGLANLFQKQGNDAEAELLFQRALRIQEQHLGQSHPKRAETLHELAIFRQQQGQLDEACSLAERAFAIRSQSLGKAHPQTVATQALYEQLLQEQPKRTKPTIEHIRTILKARGWSVHLKKQRSKFYVYATRKVGGHTQSRYLAPLSNLAGCLAAARVLPNAREAGKANGCPTERE